MRKILQTMLLSLIAFVPLCAGTHGQEAQAALPEIQKLSPELYKFKLELPKETIYELVGTNEGLGWSLAIADIIESEPHYHHFTSETYTLVTGILEVSIDGAKHVMHPGDVLVIPLDTVHSAKSLNEQPARVLVSCVPGWTQEDHILVNQ